MKKIKRIGYMVVIVIVAILSLTIYTNASKNNGENQKEKTYSEIKFIETKLANLFNTMNNIETRNYSVVTSELSKATTEKSGGGSNSSNSGSGGDESSSEGGGSSGGQGGSGEGGSSGGQSSSSDSADQGNTNEGNQDNKKFELKSNGVLTNTEDISWDSVKTEVERLYGSLPSITLDLYQLDINQEDILGFNAEYDKLTSVVKDEKKEETLTELTKLYEYLPKFLKGSGQEELYITLVETKYNIFKAYSKLDGQNWREISEDVKNAIDTYSKLLTYTDIEPRKQYNISKVYVMINELQNAVNLQDTSVFLIKYKNLQEEMNNI